MRIAISGTHSQGKSTFVRDFLDAHPNYAFETEPYRALMHKHKILFGDVQRIQDIDLQLNYCIEQVKKYRLGDCVIFDRPPADYIPYADYTATNAHTDIDKAYIQSLYKRIKPAMAYLDLIVFVPITDQYQIKLEDDGHRPTADFYRTWVDEAFKNLYRKNLNKIMPKGHHPHLIEITGPREKRIELLTAAVQKYT